MITVYESLFATHGRFVACSPRGLVRGLSSPKDFARKDDAGRWGAFRSVDGRRRREDLIEITALVYDVDEAVTLAELAAALADVHALIVSTWSATESEPRWRVVLFVDQAIAVEVQPRAWRAGAELIERVARPDAQAKDAGHIWSAPARRPGGYFECLETTGAALSVSSALERFPKEEPTLAPVLEIQNASAYARAALRSATVTIATSGSGLRNATLNREAFGIARFVTTGELAEDEFTGAMLEAAAAARIPLSEARATLRSCLRGRRTA